MRTRPSRMRQITWPVSRGSKQLHFWNLWCRFVYLPCSFGGSTMKAIKLSAKIMYGFVLKVVWVSAHARNHQLVAFTAILAIFYVHALKRLFIKFRSEFRHHLSILQPIFPYEVQNFGDLATVAIVFSHFICWKSAMFLLLVCLTQWHVKYAAGVDSHCENFRQVWSWHDHLPPSYSVLLLMHYVTLWP